MDELYEARNSIYCYPGTEVLKNKLNIHKREDLLFYETKITAAKLLSLRRKGVTGDFSVKHLKQIHYTLFEDIYPFAGEFRTENIAKGSFRFAEWEYIEEQCNILLERLQKENTLQGLNKKAFVGRLSFYMAELNVLHPFREGNGRTIREFIRQLALKNGYILNLTKVDAKTILEACMISVVDLNPLEDLLEYCME